MHGYALTRAEEHGVRVRLEPRIAESLQTPGAHARAGEHAAHGKGVPLGVLQRGLQIQKSSALRDGRQALLHGVADGDAHRLVLREQRCVKLRIAPAEIQPVNLRRECFVPQGTEKDELRTGIAQGVETVGIGEAERFVPRDGDAAACGRGVDFGRGGFAVCRERQQAVEIDRALQLRGDGLNPCRERLDLIRRLQAEVTAFELRLVHRREIPQHREPGFARKHRCEIFGEMCLAVREQQPRNLTRLPKLQHTAYLRRERESDALRPQHENHGRVGFDGDVPGARIGSGGDAVIVAHRTLQNGDVAGALLQGAAYAVLPLQKEVEIAARHAEHAGVKHGVNVIRPALIGAHVHAAAFQRREQRADGDGFARAAVHGGEHDALHSPSPTIR